MADRVRLGELLVDTGLVTADQLQSALRVQAEQPGSRVGEILVQQGVVTESQVTQVLSQQLSVPWVSLEHIDFSRQLLNLVSRETAQQFGIVPIYVRRARNRQQTLYVAMEDPTDTSPLDEIAAYSGLPVRPMIAPVSDIRAAVRAYYLGLPPEEIPTVPPGPRPESVAPAPAPAQPAVGEQSVSGTRPGPPPPPSTAAKLRAPGGAEAKARDREVLEGPVADGPSQASAKASDAREAGEPLDEEDRPPESSPIAARASHMAQPSKAADQPRMVVLTMLDGTQITLPAAPRRPKNDSVPPGPSDEMTARDLVEALRAQARGADAREVLGDAVNWESMFAALLSLLLKKHLIHDWEFVRELRR